MCQRLPATAASCSRVVPAGPPQTWKANSESPPGQAAMARRASTHRASWTCLARHPSHSAGVLLKGGCWLNLHQAWWRISPARPQRTDLRRPNLERPGHRADHHQAQHPHQAMRCRDGHPDDPAGGDALTITVSPFRRPNAPFGRFVSPPEPGRPRLPTLGLQPL